MAETLIEFVTILLAATYVVIVLSFVRGWNRLNPPPAPPHTSSADAFTTPVSVLIAARNEEKAIGRCLQAVMAQHYPAHLLEIIVIDDHSNDGTAGVVRAFQENAGAAQRRPSLKLITMNEEKPINSYKKKAIARAINMAGGELMVTTDADCWMGPDWLGTIVSAYEREGYKLISSPVAFAEEHSLFERLQSLEFMYLIGLGASAIGNAFPSTCNGANLAYTKEVFFQVDGFKGIDDLASGDDELFLHKVAALYYNKIGFLKSRSAIVYTHAKSSLRSFIQQRKRWASKSIKYRNKLVVALGLSVFFFNAALLLTACFALFNFSVAPVLLGAFVAKVLVETVFLCFLGAFFRRLPLVLWMPVLSFLHVIYMVYIGLAGQRRSYSWKGRQVK